MRTLALSPFAGLAGVAPLVARVIVGIIMTVHGLQKLAGGPASFGAFLQQLGVPLPTLTAYIVTFVELVGGILLIVGLFSRLATLLLTIDLAVAVLLVKLGVGLIAPADQPGAGYELDLALIAGFIVVLFAGPGPVSIDRILGLDDATSDRT